MKKIFALLAGAMLVACGGGQSPDTQAGGDAAPVAETSRTAPVFNRFPYGPDSALIPLDSTKLRSNPSGLKYVIIEEGVGNVPKPGQKVIAQYHGILTDGAKFDSSYDRGQPFEFSLAQGQVIRGWDEAFAMFKVGTKAIIIVPPDLGYGDRNMGNIPPNSTLIFYVELLGVV